MSKAVLMSIQPKWCEKIVDGKKTIEVRKTRPKLETPFKCYIYCTSVKNMPLMKYVEIHRKTGGKLDDWNGKVVGEFVCDKIDTYRYHKGLTRFGGDLGLPIDTYDSYLIFEDDYTAMCLTYDKLKDYGKGKTLYGWHISDLKIYDNTKELCKFRKAGFMTEEEWLYALYPNTHCHYQAWAKRFELTRPPQSWCYVEELED